MNDCLAKPYDWDQLAAAIDRAGDGALPAQDRSDREVTRLPATRLVTPEVLSRLQRTTGPEQLRMMVRTGIEAYGCYCDVMLDPASDAADIGREAHKLSGSAGTFGFERISVLAAQIEDTVDGHSDATALVLALKTAIDETRAELVRMGALADG